MNLRTLQQSELKTKDISRASVQTVLALANVLGCQAEDLLEYSTEEYNNVPIDTTQKLFARYINER